MSCRKFAVPIGLTLSAFVGGSGAATAWAAFTSSVSVSGYTSLDNGTNQTPITATFTTDPLTGIKSVTGSGSAALENQADGLVSLAGVEGSASVQPGQLRVAIHALAIIGAGEPNVPTITHGTPRAFGSFGATFADEVRFQSNTLAPGTPMTYRVTWRMHAVTNRPGHVGPMFAGHDTGTWHFNYYAGPSVGTTESFPNAFITTIPPRDFEIYYDIPATVGDILFVGASLALGADDRAGWYDDNGSLFSYGGLEETHIDASNTVGIFIDSLTPGASVVSDSGHDYSVNAVPEPPSFILCAFLATAMWRLRRCRRVGLL